jgi:hypothetical protein
LAGIGHVQVSGSMKRSERIESDRFMFYFEGETVRIKFLQLFEAIAKVIEIREELTNRDFFLLHH